MIGQTCDACGQQKSNVMRRGGSRILCRGCFDVENEIPHVDEGGGRP